MRFSLSAGLLALILAVLVAVVLRQPAVHGDESAPAAAESGSFEIAQHGHGVGTASFQFAPAKGGYDSIALVKVAMQGLNYALSKTEQLSPGNELKHALVSATVNGEAVTVVTSPDSAQFLVKIAANGKNITARLAYHPETVLMADFDPGALQTLLALAAQHSNRGLWVILPKNTVTINPVQLATYPDQQGTLNGSAIVVHHLIATISGTTTDIFSGPKNQLLQAELPQEGFALVRTGFVLQPPAKPIVPPPAPPPAQQPAQQQTAPAPASN
jgi:hypothetical protein